MYCATQRQVRSFFDVVLITRVLAKELKEAYEGLNWGEMK